MPQQSEPRPTSQAESATAASIGAPSRMSQGSLPFSALVSPHAPSVARSAGGATYHMRDPRKPPRVQPTGWALTFGVGSWRQGGGSPTHAWLFFVGFVLFPLWWVAGFCVPVPRTRRMGGEGGLTVPIVLDDPQVESDAMSWRRWCRIMAIVSMVTYVPFLVLVAVFVPRSIRH
ncbi:hypothetical protein B0H14DRAFT_2532833 [Mycena olivaceomarginata]|nr:hypothetical protein B0H14DRAFT_2532833 [Mycena olivaceomarginata]